MTGRVSVIVPTKDSGRTIEACLRSIREQTHPDVELIIVDNGSRDGTPDIGRRYADLFLTLGPERSTQRNVGAQRSTGEFLVFVDSDMVLPPPVAEEVALAFSRDPSLAALVIPERATGLGFWARCRAIEKELYVGDREIEAARAFRRERFIAMGGFDEEIQAGGEDWELSERIREADLRVGRIEACILHDEGHLTLREDLRKKFYYGAGLRRYAAKRPARALRKVTRRRVSRLFKRAAEAPVHTAGIITLKVLEAFAVVAGMAARARGPRSAVAPRRIGSGNHT